MKKQLCPKDLNVQSCGDPLNLWKIQDLWMKFQLLSAHEFNELMLGGPAQRPMDFIWFRSAGSAGFECWDPGWRFAGFLVGTCKNQSESELPAGHGRWTAGTCPHRGLVQIIFLSKWVICMFQPLIFQGVGHSEHWKYSESIWCLILSHAILRNLHSNFSREKEDHVFRGMFLFQPSCFRNIG